MRTKSSTVSMTPASASAFANQRLEPLHHNQADRLDARRRRRAGASWIFAVVSTRGKRQARGFGVGPLNMQEAACDQLVDEDWRHHRDVDIASAGGLDGFQRCGPWSAARTNRSRRRARLFIRPGNAASARLVHLVSGGREPKKHRLGAGDRLRRGRRADDIGRRVVGPLAAAPRGTGESVLMS